MIHEKPHIYSKCIEDRRFNFFSSSTKGWYLMQEIPSKCFMCSFKANHDQLHTHLARGSCISSRSTPVAKVFGCPSGCDKKFTNWCQLHSHISDRKDRNYNCFDPMNIDKIKEKLVKVSQEKFGYLRFLDIGDHFVGLVTERNRRVNQI